MTPYERLFSYRHAFDHPLTLYATVSIAALLVVAGAIIAYISSGRRERYVDLISRYRSWVWITILAFVPLLLGAAWVMAAVGILCLLCYREYARATGLFRRKIISFVIVIAILVQTFATFDHYDRFFFATAPLSMALIAMVTIQFDDPKGYVQRVALGVLGFLMCGFSLGYVGFIANDVNYRPLLIFVLVTVEMNDVFAYCVGKLIGGPKLLPNTSPKKTVAGSTGALILTTALAAFLGHIVLRGTAVDRPGHLVTLGIMISILGQMGDLVLSSIKRDVGIKDFDVMIPGHGGLLDRFDSLILVAPAVFHYLSLYIGPLGSDQPQRIITGG